MSQPRPTLIPVFISEDAAALTISGVSSVKRPRLSSLLPGFPSHTRFGLGKEAKGVSYIEGS